MTDRTQSLQKSILQTWFLATFYGWLLGFVAIIVLALLAEAVGPGGSQFFLGLGTGLGMGFTQARWLKRRYGTGWWWMWASGIGMGLSFTFFDLGHRRSDLLPDYNLYYSVIGGSMLIGLLQDRTLRSLARPISLVDSRLHVRVACCRCSTLPLREDE